EMSNIKQESSANSSNSEQELSNIEQESSANKQILNDQMLSDTEIEDLELITNYELDFQKASE
ncbi:9135_t:CDS:1, partial [Racocetra fulgida]